MSEHEPASASPPVAGDPCASTSLALRVESVSAEVVRPLRGAVLRPGLPLDRSVYEFDDDPLTVHIAAYDARSGAIVGVATGLPQACADRVVDVDCPEVLAGPPGQSGDHPGSGLLPGARALPGACPGARVRRLRGMAVSPEAQGLGVGRAVLEALLAEAQRRDDAPSGNGAVSGGGLGSGGGWWWANARTSALGFYERQGWRVVSAEFEIPGVCPHVVMVKAPA
ncbi:MAG: GNAT family N-acetyltransferase [Planctomycetota bacterium]